jgi:membrane-bound serine protease (ClpP class)
VIARWRSMALALALLLGIPLQGLAESIYVISIDGGINPAVGDYLSKGIRQAEAAGAHALVIELDTPGGLLSTTKDIVEEILGANIPIIVFVSPRGAWAASAGTFITMAGHIAAMAPGTTIGAAHPVPAVGGTPPKPGGPWPGADDEEDAPGPVRDIAGEKIENFTAAFIESIAESRNRNVEWAIDAVRNSVAITAAEAVEERVVDLLADDLDYLLEEIDGRVVTINRQEVTLATKDAQIVRIEMSLTNRFFNVISNPTVAFLLFLGGLLGLYMEFNQPGMIVPGVLGIVGLILAGLAFQVIPFSWIGLLLLLAGIGLMVAELFVASLGVLFGLGVVSMALGGYLLFDVPELSDLSVPFWQIVFPVVAGFAVVGAIIVIGVSRSMARPQFAGNEGMLGELALADSDIDPSGRVLYHGEYWNAVAAETIRTGDKVRIVQVQDLELRVVRADNPGEETT